jgi:hypothetical protein
MDVIQNLD